MFFPFNPRFLFACFLASSASIVGSPAQAQRSPDQTLGVESSVVTPNVVIQGELSELIEGGATRGTNLFHSFSEFNIDTSEQVYFASPAGIESIISRVTGSSLSTIGGLLGTTGESEADLILINPNGISFEGSANLNVQGAFTATTAAGIKLGETGLFSTTEPDRDNILAVEPSAFFFNNLTDRGDITAVGSSLNLQVLAGQSLRLLGGDVLIDGSLLAAPGGQINLGALSGTGTVGISEESLDFSENIQRGAIRLENDALVIVRDSTAGEISLLADSIEILSGSQLAAGIDFDQGNAESQAGAISLDATGLVKISDSNTQLRNDILNGAEGRPGNIQISANTIQLTDAAQISTDTFGAGSAGDIALLAQDEVLIEGSRVSSFTDAQTEGKSGSLRIAAGSVSIVDGSSVSSEIFGKGDAGNVVVQAENTISLDNSSAFVSVGDGAQGQGGDVQIQAGDALLAANGSSLNSSTFGDGDAGSVVIQAENRVVFDSSAALNLVGDTAEGRGGGIQISTRSLSATNGSSFNSSLFGRGTAGSVVIKVEEGALLDSSDLLSTLGESAEGKGGDIRIEAGALSVANGAGLSSSTFGEGDAGNVVIQSEGAVSFDNSIAFSAVEDSAKGQGGDVQITAGALSVLNESNIDSSTFGTGDAGSVVVFVEDIVRVDGSAVSSVVKAAGIGAGGNVSIESGALSLTDGSSLNSSTFGTGSAGNVVIRVRNSAALNSSAVFSAVDEKAVGAGGELRIEAGSLTLANDSSLSSSTLGRGRAGNIVIAVSEDATFDGSGLFSVVGDVAIGEGGNVQLKANSLAIVNGSELNSNTFGQGDAGDIFILVEEGVLIESDRTQQLFASQISSSVGDIATGTGGDIQLTAGRLHLEPSSGIFADSLGNGDAGSIEIVLEGLLEAEGGTIATNSRSNAGGQIQVEARGIILQGDSDIQTFVSSGEREGGSIVIDANAIVLFDDSDILAFSQEGTGGDIDLQQTALFSRPLNPISRNLTRAELTALEGNNRVDINATGATASGQISTDDNVLIDNDLAVLPDTFESADVLVASSCISRSQDDSGAFVLTGRDRPQQSPTDTLSIPYPTRTVSPVPSAESAALQEPQALYQLANGRFIISHRCQ